MFYQLSPAGNPVCLSRDNESEALLQIFGATYQPHYFASGTAALAAAIATTIKLKAVDEPEVILPAYGCPDLVSAAVFAGVKPVLVDLEVNRPWMDLEQLSQKLNARTVAIIAVDLFGISERLDKLRALAEKADAVLIEDSAQAFPGSKEQDIWKGDLVVLSFGRGKPVGLLGGGAVLVRNRGSIGGALGELVQNFSSQANGGFRNRLAFNLKSIFYNRMISPRLYWLPHSLPFLRLGETHYYPLTSIEGMDRARLSVLPSNVKAYREDLMETQNSLSAMLDEIDLEGSGITDLPRVCKMPEGRRLLRYPLLVGAGARDQLYEKLHKTGLGPSCMYPAALPEISGLGPILSQHGVFPAASSFAERLLTLPTHLQVSWPDIDKMRQVLMY